MFKKVVFICLFYFVVFICPAQKMSLYELTSLCSKKRWEDVNKKLNANGWDYYDSEKGNSEKYNIITWSYDKESYSDKAQAWFYLYTYESYPNKVRYQFFNKQSYTIVEKSFQSFGFKLIDSEIGNNELTSTYENSNYILEIITSHEKSDDWSSTSYTAYEIVLIRKSSVYDTKNGPKKDYYEDGSVKAEYFLKNGELDGLFKVYFKNGVVKKSGYFKSGIENGAFKEYDEFGKLSFEYTMRDGKLHGVYKFYEDENISYLTNYQNGVRSGQHIEFHYDKNNELFIKEFRNYKNGAKDGIWKTFIIDEGEEQLFTFVTYQNDKLHGAFQNIEGDSLILGSFFEGLFHGNFKIYRDITKIFFGGIISTDTSSLTLVSEGKYQNDLKTGKWKYYSLSGNLKSEGNFYKGEKSGLWKYYYDQYVDNEGQALDYSGLLYRKANYFQGKLNGASYQYSYLDEKKYLCSEEDRKKSNSDTCKILVCKKIYEIANYTDNILNGYYELRDSNNQIAVKGSYDDGDRSGIWTQRYIYSQEEDGEVVYIYEKGSYVNDLKHGEWIEYISEDHILRNMNYNSGKLHGKYTQWNSQNKPSEIKTFRNGIFKELVKYDSLGETIVTKYEIFGETFNGINCRVTKYNEDSYESQEYWFKKEEDQIDHNWFEIEFLLGITVNSSERGYRAGEYRKVIDRYKTIVSGSYLKEDKVDLWTYYYYDQGIYIESNYENNKKIR
jgi:antitoxin component YwqK of YwqJK toxin-antitoxin module